MDKTPLLSFFYQSPLLFVSMPAYFNRTPASPDLLASPSAIKTTPAIAKTSAIKAALQPPAQNLYELERKIEMILSYPCKGFTSIEQLVDFQAIVKDIYVTRNKRL